MHYDPRALDAHITGNYGADQFPEDPADEIRAPLQTYTREEVRRWIARARTARDLAAALEIQDPADFPEEMVDRARSVQHQLRETALRIARRRRPVRRTLGQLNSRELARRALNETLALGDFADQTTARHLSPADYLVYRAYIGSIGATLSVLTMRLEEPRP